MRSLQLIGLAGCLFIVSACSGMSGSSSAVNNMLPSSGATGGATSSNGGNISGSYTLTDLGTGLPGAAWLVPSAINNSGEVVGNASIGILSSLPCPATCAPVPAGWVYKNGHLTALKPLGTDTIAIADDINNAGVISGGSGTASTEEAVLWEPSGTIVNLGTGIAGPGSQAEATSISNSNNIVGVSTVGGPYIPTQFDGKGGASNPCGSAAPAGILNAVNDSGESVGVAPSPNGKAAISCNPFNVIATPPPTTDKPGIDFAQDINDSGQIVGRLTIGPSFGNFHPYVYQNGKLTDLGTPLFPNDSAAVGAAFGNNDEGAVVGWEGAGGGVPGTPPVDMRAFLWAKGKMVDLNSLLPGACKDWTLVIAYGINNRGQIVGAGFVGGYPNGVEHGFLLTPNP